MAAIPVPVHFDGHNINIITEDSPSTCKNRTKGINYGKNKNNKKKRNTQNGKYNKKFQALNKGQKSKQNEEAHPTKTLIISPNPSNSPNPPQPTPSNKENIDQHQIKNKQNNKVAAKQTVCPLPLAPNHSNKDIPQHPKQAASSQNSTATSPSNNMSPQTVQNNINSPSLNPDASNKSTSTLSKQTHNNKIDENAQNAKLSAPPLPLPPQPMSPNNPNQQTIQNKVPSKPSNSSKPSISSNNNSSASTQITPTKSFQCKVVSTSKPPRLPLPVPANQNKQRMESPQTLQQRIANEQNKQLIAGGLDPNEFGSHDDVGFDDEDPAQNGQGKDRQNLYKTELCREWSTSGWCYYNKRCSFAHGLQELRPVFRSKKWRTKRCRNWHTTGYCPYEHRCQFLHDQSPPRRISDYATANARALVAAQQRMQPLYFHYQVDCNRDETTDDDGDKGEGQKKEQTPNGSIPNTPKQNTTNIQNGSPLATSVGPRLKRKDYRKGGNKNRQNMNGGNKQGINNGNMAGMVAANHSNGNENGKRGAVRMVKQGNGPNNNNKRGNSPKIGAGGPRNANKPKNGNGKRKNSPKPPRNSGAQNNKTGKNKKKKQKDAVITPFNPVSTYGAAATSNYEVAVQQLGLYNPAMARTPGALGIPTLGALPPLPTTVPINAFQGLPPSIDPTLYLSLTPSPPDSPEVAHNAPMHNEMVPPLHLDNKLKKRGLNVEVPVSLTPSPPTLAINHHNNQLNGIPHETLQIQLAKQQQTLNVLHAKVQQLADGQAAHAAQQQETVTAVLMHRSVNNKSATPVAPIDGDMLQSLLPNDEFIEANKIKTENMSAPGSNNNNITKNTEPGSANNDEIGNVVNSVTNITIKSDTRFNIENNTKITAVGSTGNMQPTSVPNKKTTNNNSANSQNNNNNNDKSLPPIPPIPPPLQLQTSINSVVSGAVRAAMTPTGVPSLVPMTPTLIDQSGKTGHNQLFAYPAPQGIGSAANVAPNVLVSQTNGNGISSIPQTMTPLATASQLGSVPVNTVIPIGSVPTATPQIAAYGVPASGLTGYAPVPPPGTTYAQQAHAHAHAYASAHAQPVMQYAHIAAAQHTATGHVGGAYGAQYAQIPAQHHANPGAAAYGVPLQPQIGQIGYPPFYAPSPDFQEIPQHGTYYANPYNAHRHHY